MAYEVRPPRFAWIINEIQQRIEDGTYPPGSMLPSEHQLTAEFSVSRPTLVRSLNILRDDGWIESQQGKGRFVRGKPAVSGRRASERFQHSVDVEETAGIELIGVRTQKASPRIAAALHLPDKGMVVVRHRRTVGEGGPIELTSSYFPKELTEGTDLPDTKPIRGGARVHLQARKGVRTDYLTERLSARLPTDEEAKRLEMPDDVPVITVLLVAYDANGQPLQAVDLVLPADRHDIEEMKYHY